MGERTQMPRIVVRVLWWAIIRDVDWLTALIYRRYCPRPIGDYYLARDCVRLGKCGCDNQGQFPAAGGSNG